MAKTRWACEEVIGKYRIYARPSRSDIIVRIEIDGDTSKYAEYGYPKLLGLGASMHQAALEVSPEDIKP